MEFIYETSRNIHGKMEIVFEDESSNTICLILELFPKDVREMARSGQKYNSVKNEEKRGRGLFSPFSGKVEKWNSGKNEEKRDNSFSRKTKFGEKRGKKERGLFSPFSGKVEK